MELSIVIVNYNVKHFLRQCLASVYASTLSPNQYEVWVVDNASVDGSMAMVAEEFPQAKRIASTENLGFSKGNNLAITKANGRYILLLNPDTIIQEDTLALCIDYCNHHPNTGALGVKMVDGSGTFLPESKRGLPTLWNSFCKMTGLSSLFRGVKLFSGYTLSHLPTDQTAKVDVLCGAYMMMPRQVIEEVGSLDERFFMYGEDIDLSYRIGQAGYDIVYFPETQIIHFKGESSKKGSLNYVKIFYNAMIQYVQKHYTGAGSFLFVLALKLAIVLRAVAAFISGGLRGLILPFLTVAAVCGLAWGIQRGWASYQFGEANYYADSPLWYTIAGFAGLSLATQWLVGVYHQYSMRRAIAGMIGATLLALAIYGLLDSEWRSSRAVLLFTGAAATIVVPILQSLAKRWQRREQAPKIIIVGEAEHAQSISKNIQSANPHAEVVGAIHPTKQQADNQYVAPIQQIAEISKIMKINEILFVKGDIDMNGILNTMRETGPDIRYKIGGDDLLNFVGSSSKNHQGQVYSVDIAFRLSSEDARRNKRILDIMTSCIALLLSPVIWVLRRFDLGFWRDSFTTLSGKKTWVGYTSEEHPQLPDIKASVIDIDRLGMRAIDYARHYSATDDILPILRYLAGSLRKQK